MPSWTRCCVECGGEFHTKGGRTFRCPECQPLYRHAYNLYHSALKRAKKAQLALDLTPSWILERLWYPCPRTGLAFASPTTTTGRVPHSPSLDRIDPRKGYTKRNVQVVAWWYNQAKGEYTDEEVLHLCRLVVKKHTMKASS